MSQSAIQTSRHVGSTFIYFCKLFTVDALMYSSMMLLIGNNQLSLTVILKERSVFEPIYYHCRIKVTLHRSTQISD